MVKSVNRESKILANDHHFNIISKRSRSKIPVTKHNTLGYYIPQYQGICICGYALLTLPLLKH